MTISQMAKIQSQYQTQMFQTQQPNKSYTGPTKSYLGETPPPGFPMEHLESFNRNKHDPWMYAGDMLTDSAPEKRILEVPEKIDEQVHQIMRDLIIEQGGYWKPGENTIGDLAKEYIYSKEGLANVKPQDRMSMVHSMNKLAHSYGDAYVAKIKEHYPDWDFGQSVDASIFEGWEPTIRKSIDVKI